MEVMAEDSSFSWEKIAMILFIVGAVLVLLIFLYLVVFRSMMMD